MVQALFVRGVKLVGTDHFSLAGAQDEEVNVALGPLDEAIAAQTAEPVATAGVADADDVIEFGPDSTDDAPPVSEELDNFSGQNGRVICAIECHEL